MIQVLLISAWLGSKAFSIIEGNGEGANCSFGDKTDH